MFAYPLAAPGEDAGFAVVTDRFVCLLGPESAPRAATRLYRVLDGADFHIGDALDFLAAEAGIDRFAIVEVLDPAERSMQVAVFGAITVDIVGSVSTRLSGPTAAGVTSDAKGVSSLLLSIEAEEPTGERVPIRRGVVRTAAVAVDETTHDTPESSDPALEPSTATVPIQIPSSARLKKVALDPVPVPAPKRPTKRKPAKKPTARAEPAKSLDQTNKWSIRLPDGSELDLAKPIVVGRRPWRSMVEDTASIHVVAPSPRREISGVHLELAVRHGGLEARDLASTNGTIIFSGSRAPRLLHESKSSALLPGDILDLGEGFQLFVTDPHTPVPAS